jgi:hypothetical protein
LGIGGENAGTLDLGDSFTDVPGGTAHWVFTGNGNYNNQSGDATIEITKADASILVNGFSGAYDAASHGATLDHATGVGGVDLSAGIDLGDSFTDVPGGIAHWTFDGGINYNDQAGDATIEITKADASILVNGFSGAYDAASHGATLDHATGVGGVDLSAGIDLGDSFMDVPGGTAHWTFDGNENYNAASGDVDIIITKADATIDVVGFTGIYDGNAHGASGTATGISDADLSAGFDFGATFTDVPGGTAHWTFDGGTNYNNDEGDVDIVINKANAIINVNGYSGVYDGLAHGATGSAMGVETMPADLNGLLHLGASFTNVPGGTANWTFDGNNNYNTASGSVAIDITKANAHFTINGYTGVYDSAAHGATGSAIGVEVIPANLSSLLHLGASFTNVPGGIAHWTFDGNGNYNTASGDATINITKADAVIDVTDYHVTYDGNSHTATGTAKGVLDEALSGLDLSGTTHTAAGSYPDTWTFTDVTGNYNDDSGTVNDSIGKADAACLVTGYSVTYDGSAHTATGVCTGVGGSSDVLSGLDLGGTTHTVAGSYTDTWTFTDVTGNYNNQSHTVSDSIGKATPVITWANPADITYNAALGATQLNATASAAGSFVYTPADGTVLNAGMGQTLHADFTPTDTANYNNASKDVSINVLKASSTTTVSCPLSVTYDGSAQSPCTALVTGAGGLSQSVSVSYSNNTNAGTANASASFTGDANHTGSSDSKDFTISKASSTTVVTFEAGPYVYRGTAFTATAVVTGAGGLNQPVAIVYSGDCTNVTSANGCTATATFAGDPNHDGSNDSKSITIIKANQTITFVPVANKVLGNPDFSVSATAGSGLPVSFTASPASVCTISGSTVHLTGVGTCTVTASQAGNSNYNAATPVSHSFTVSYMSAGMCLGSANHAILQPINVDGTSVSKQGSTVPAKFRVCDANGNSIGTPGVVASFRLVATITGTTVETVNEVVDSTTPDTAFRWDATDKQWIYNINTKSLVKNKTYVYLITLNDGSTIQFQFGLK